MSKYDTDINIERIMVWTGKVEVPCILLET